MHLFLLAILFAPQEPAPVDVEKLVEELHGKVSAFKSVSGKFRLEAVDAKGASELRYTSEFHCKPSEGWLFFSMKKEPSGETNSMMFEQFTTIRSWTDKGPGNVVEMSAAMTNLWKSLWRAGQEQCRVMDEPDPYPRFEAYVAHLKPMLFIELNPADPKRQESSFRVALGKSGQGGVSWLRLIRKAASVTANEDKVTVVEKDPARTTVIARRTGWIRSMTVHAAGEGRRIVFSEFVADTALPTIKRPEAWKTMPASIRNDLSMVAPGIRMTAESDLESFLKNWDKAGREDRAEALRGYFARIGAELRSFIRSQMQVYWAADFVKQAVKRGDTLDDLQRDIEEHAGALDTYLQQVLKTHGGLLNQYLEEVRKELEGAVDKSSSGVDASRRQLKLRMQEGFQPERVGKVASTYPALTAERLLLDAITSAREEEKKQ